MRGEHADSLNVKFNDDMNKSQQIIWKSFILSVSD
jgi:hypothetical protein